MAEVEEFAAADLVREPVLRTETLKPGQKVFHPLWESPEGDMVAHRRRLINGYKSRARAKYTSMAGATFTTRTAEHRGDPGVWVCRLN